MLACTAIASSNPSGALKAIQRDRVERAKMNRSAQLNVEQGSLVIYC